MINKLTKFLATTLSAITVLSMGLSMESLKADSYNPNIVTFVTSLYSDCLGRQPDQAGLDDWCGRLTRGEITGKQCAYGFFFSPEFLSKANSITDFELVESYYRVFLNRSSDDGGKAYWVERIIDTNNDVSILFSGFADSTEFAQKCASYGIIVGNSISVPVTNRTEQRREGNYQFNHYADGRVTVQWLDANPTPPDETIMWNTIDTFIAANNLTSNDLTLEQKADIITRYVAHNYYYDVHYSDALSMVTYGCGDCWASTYLIINIARRCGLEAYVRYANQDPGAGSGHLNALIVENGTYYICEAGFVGTNENGNYRQYYITRVADNEVCNLRYYHD